LMAVGLGMRDPWPADEPRFALIAQDMLRSGDWLIPRVGGDLYADKPPFFFWLLATAMALTGSMRVGFLLPRCWPGLVRRCWYTTCCDARAGGRWRCRVRSCCC